MSVENGESDGGVGGGDEGFGLEGAEGFAGIIAGSVEERALEPAVEIIADIGRGRRGRRWGRRVIAGGGGGSGGADELAPREEEGIMGDGGAAGQDELLFGRVRVGSSRSAEDDGEGGVVVSPPPV